MQVAPIHSETRSPLSWKNVNIMHSRVDKSSPEPCYAQTKLLALFGSPPRKRTIDGYWQHAHMSAIHSPYQKERGLRTLHISLVNATPSAGTSFLYLTPTTVDGATSSSTQRTNAARILCSASSESGCGCITAPNAFAACPP